MEDRTVMPTTRAERRKRERDNRREPPILTPVPRELWPEQREGADERICVWRSRDFLVQAFSVRYGSDQAAVRLSVNRTRIDQSVDRWSDAITWDELQMIKTQCGFHSHWAVEVYPPVVEEINVANMRHLWVTLEAPAFAWRTR